MEEFHVLFFFGSAFKRFFFLTFCFCQHSEEAHTQTRRCRFVPAHTLFCLCVCFVFPIASVIKGQTVALARSVLIAYLHEYIMIARVSLVSTDCVESQFLYFPANVSLWILNRTAAVSFVGMTPGVENANFVGKPRRARSRDGFRLLCRERRGAI